MTSLVGIAIVLIALGWCALIAVLFAPEIMRRNSGELVLDESGETITQYGQHGENLLTERIGIRLYRDAELEIAGMRTSAASLSAMTLVTVFVVLISVLAMTGMPLLALLAAALVPVGFKVYVGHRAEKVRRKFEDQLDEALTLMASALKSGMNIPTAVQTASREMAPPMGSELTRVVNANALGRDLVDGMRETAERMQSRSFMWVSEAIAIQRESGGRLSEILDRVLETLSKRHEMQERVRSLSADGRISGVVLMALPVVVFIFFMAFNPAFVAPLWQTSGGNLILAVSAVLYAVGGLWMRAITRVKL